ncbi:Alternative cytochrome c oxidase subunit 2 [bacterium HR15]|nr:Alternative cytochrome c oxidase subunit 2 [bacterium HR15]
MAVSQQQASSRDRRTGFVLGVALWLFTLATLWLFGANLHKMPPPASDFAPQIDAILWVILGISVIGFVGLHLYLGWVALSRPAEVRAIYLPADRPKEWLWVLVPIGLLLVADLTFDHMSNKVWGAFFGKPPANAFEVEVTGQQFAWHVRYPGADGRFGRTNPRLISDENPIGLDLSDPAARDDILLINVMHVPEGRPVMIYLRSRDVLHSFFLPPMRIKMDCVPGYTTRMWFTPQRKGNYEIACAELCGMGHYNMKGLLVVEDEQAVQNWLAQQTPFSKRGQ